MRWLARALIINQTCEQVQINTDMYKMHVFSFLWVFVTDKDTVYRWNIFVSIKSGHGPYCSMKAWHTHIVVSWELYIRHGSLLGTPTGQFTPPDIHWTPHTSVPTLPPYTKLWFSHRWSVVRQLLGLRQGSPLGRRCNLCLGKTAACLKLSTHNSCAAAALRHLVTSVPKIRHRTQFIGLPHKILKSAQKKSRLVWIHLAERLTGLWKHIQVEMLAKTAVLWRQSVVRAEGRRRLFPLRTITYIAWRPQKGWFL